MWDEVSTEYDNDTWFYFSTPGHLKDAVEVLFHSPEAMWAYIHNVALDV